MEQNKQMERIADLMNNEEAAEKLEACSNLEEAAEILGEYGVEMDPEVLRNLCMQNTDEELSENDLNDVSGGGWLWNFFKRRFSRRCEKNYDDIHGMAQGLRNR